MLMDMEAINATVSTLIYYNENVQTLTSTGGHSGNGSLLVCDDDMSEMLRASGVNLKTHQSDL